MKKKVRIIRRCCCYRRCCSKDINYKEMLQLLEKSSFLIIDVRSEQEYKEGHMSGAINIPLYAVKSVVPKKVKDKNQSMILYCSGGIRSKKAQIILESMGYQNVYNVTEGFR